MKKRYIKFALQITFIFAILSCSDDVSQPGFLSPDNAFNSLEDLQSGLNGVYGRYAPDRGTNGQGGEIYLNSIFTDEVKAGLASNGQGSQLFNFNYDPTTSTWPSHVIWEDYYRMIGRCNIVLEAFNGVDVNATEQTEANHVKGQLFALRGLSHMKILEYYAPDYNNTSALGVINVDFVPNVTDQLPRNTFGETLALISSDFDQADALLDPSQTSNIFINPDVMKALRARLALLQQDYPTAMQMASELVASYPLANQAQYTSMYQDTNDTEIIFKLARVAGNSTPVLNYFFNFMAAGSNDSYLDVSNELYNLYAVNDIRRTTVVNSGLSTINGVDDPTNLLVLGKYPGSADGLAINDIKVFRSSEMLLILAETQARAGSLTDAATSLKTLRDARLGVGTPLATYANLNEALTDILLERRKELCFEGHRFLDLKRLGPELGIGVNRSSVDCDSFSAASCVLSPTDARFTVPIPQAEIDANQNIQSNPSN